jgi:phosphohistidine swiveling domain-containing protein
MAVVGRGLVVSGSGCEGTGRQANELAQVFELLKDPALGDAVLLVESPSATAIVPLLSKVKGIVCADGGMTSHLAIVSREFGLPCVMAADVASLADLDGKPITVSAEGEIAVG